MRKLSLSLLAATALMASSGAFAQAAPPPPGGMYGGGMRMRHTTPLPGPHFRHMQRGFIVPQFWWGPQFQINNWQMYGFANPGPDGRWIRYYDDAYLIDRDGRILDTREGLDWDRYGEEWDMADGIPAYRGRRDYRPGAEDYEWAEEHEGRGEHMRGMYMRHGGPPMGPPMGPPPGYGYGGGYTQVYGGGYGYGAYAYPIMIETTTTTGAAQQTYSEEVIEEYQTVRRAHHRARPRCLCQAPRTVVRYVPRTVVRYVQPPRPVHRAPPPRPRPPAGERG